MSLPDQMTDRWQNRPEPPTGRGRRVLAPADARLSRGRGAGPPGSAAASRIRRPANDPAAMAARDHAAGRASRRLLPKKQAPADDPDRRRPSRRHACSRRHPRSDPLPPRSRHARRHTRRDADGNYDAARSATHQVTGAHAPDGQPARWRPHLTICYSTSRQPAQPIIDALGTRLPGCDIAIRALSLVIQHGPERTWDWSIKSTIRLATPART